MNRTSLAGYILMVIVLALGVGAGILIAALPTGPGDLLSLPGALLGAGIAVIGAVVVLEWQGQVQAQAQRKMLVELVEDVLAKCQMVRNPAPNREFEVPVVILGNVDFLQESIQRVQAARQWVTPDSGPATLRSFRHC
jgi:hypothetical protein